MTTGRIADIGQYAAAGLTLPDKARWREGFLDRPGFEWTFAGQPLRVPELVCQIVEYLRDGSASPNSAIRNAFPVMRAMGKGDVGQILAWLNVFTVASGPSATQSRAINLVGRELLRQWDRAKNRSGIFVVGKPRLLAELIEERKDLADWLHEAAPGDVRTLPDGTAIVATRRG